MTTRRVAAGAVLALALPLAACGGSDGDAAAGGGWTFTDDIGTEIERDEVPDRIVAQSSVAAALTDLGLGDKVVGVFGPLTNPDGEPDLQAVGLDVDAVEDVTGSGEYGDLDLEKIAELQPDLIVTSTYLEPEPWYVNEATLERLEGQFPVAIITFQDQSQTEIFDNTERIAEALGADPADFAEGREAFEAASERLRSVVEEVGDPTFQAVSTSPDIFYVSNPDANPDLRYSRDELGLDIVTPADEDLDEGGYWQTLSWEEADRYDADVALWDARGGSAALDLLEGQPVWTSTTAGREDAYVEWNTVAPPSAQGRATIMELFADRLEELG